MLENELAKISDWFRIITPVTLMQHCMNKEHLLSSSCSVHSLASKNNVVRDIKHALCTDL